MARKESEKSNDWTALGRLLKEAREYLSLSQDEVSQAINVPRSAISLIESGQRKIDVMELRKLAEIYQRPVEYFTGETEGRETPADVQHLARKASELSEQDRIELLRFAEFLQSKSQIGEK